MASTPAHLDGVWSLVPAVQRCFRVNHIIIYLAGYQLGSFHHELGIAFGADLSDEVRIGRAKGLIRCRERLEKGPD